MSLSSRRFVAFQRLKAAANNQALIKLGETGGAVQAIQLALLSLKFEMPVSTNNYSQVADGIFGNETRSTVKAFQAKHALLPDGIVGKQTLGKLDKLFSATSRNLPPSCGNCSRNVNVYHPPGMIQAALSAESDRGWKSQIADEDTLYDECGGEEGENRVR